MRRWGRIIIRCMTQAAMDGCGWPDGMDVRAGTGQRCKGTNEQ